MQRISCQIKDSVFFFLSLRPQSRCINFIRIKSLWENWKLFSLNSLPLNIYFKRPCSSYCRLFLLYIFELSKAGCTKSQMCLLIHYNSLDDATAYCTIKTISSKINIETAQGKDRNLTGNCSLMQDISYRAETKMSLIVSSIRNKFDLLARTTVIGTHF